MSAGHRVLAGAVSAVAAAPLAAAVVATLYRFPVPFGGYARGWSDAPAAALASVFYLILGGAVVLAGLGCLAGALVRSVRTAALLGGLVAVLGALTLATLEYVVGTW